MQASTIFRVLGVCLGAALALCGLVELFIIYQAGMVSDAYFYYTSYRYGYGKQGMQMFMAALTVLGLGIIVLSLRGRR